MLSPKNCWMCSLFMVGALLVLPSSAAAGPCDGLPTAEVEKAMGGPVRVAFEEKLRTCVFRTQKPGMALVSLMKETASKKALDGVEKDAKAFLQRSGERKNKRLAKKGKPLLPTPLIAPVVVDVNGKKAAGFYAQSNQSVQLRFGGSRWVVRVKVDPKTDRAAAEAIAKAWLSTP